MSVMSRPDRVKRDDRHDGLDRPDRRLSLCYTVPMLRWIRAILLGDMFYLMAFGMISPIFALFLQDRIPGATVMGVGMAEAAFLLSLATLRPFVHLSTRNDGRGWRTQSHLWFGSFLTILAPFLLLLARDMLDVIVIQMIYGTGVAFAEPAWSRLMDRTCGIDDASKQEPKNAANTLLAAGIAVLGGFIAQYEGMPALLYFLGMTLIGAALIMSILYHQLGRFTPRKTV